VISGLLKGGLVGFAIAAPVGPIGVLCIRRSVAKGQLAGFVSGLGAATADTLFGALAAAGIGAVTSFLVAHRGPIQLFGGAFMVALGIQMVRKHRQSPPAGTDDSGAAGLFRDYLSTLGLTLANPSTILSFIAIFAGIGIGASLGPIAAAQLVAGVFAGSACWWLILSTTAGWLGSRLQAKGLAYVNLLAGLSIALFGGYNFVAALGPSLPWKR
jgi:threonine/homoserine/homoserine lactone efflux protein